MIRRASSDRTFHDLIPLSARTVSRRTATLTRHSDRTSWRAAPPAETNGPDATTRPAPSPGGAVGTGPWPAVPGDQQPTCPRSADSATPRPARRGTATRPETRP
jgi:hypothetical protein